jgi:phospholipase/carboxylesterase
MKSEYKILEINDWVIRYHKPETAGPYPVIWLLHGWKGDEESMWIFVSQLPTNYLILAPRGRFPAENGGYSWYPIRKNGWPTLDVLKPATYKLLGLMESWPLMAPWGDFSSFRLAGFSQGAALAYAFTILNPDRVQAVAGLAGFLPVDAEKHLTNISLQGLTAYISHGSKDEIVPIEKAREAVRLLEKSGANVTFCESDVGHKLSADCFNNLEVFFEE